MGCKEFVFPHEGDLYWVTEAIASSLKAAKCRRARHSKFVEALLLLQKELRAC